MNPAHRFVRSTRLTRHTLTTANKPRHVHSVQSLPSVTARWTRVDYSARWMAAAGAAACSWLVLSQANELLMEGSVMEIVRGEDVEKEGWVVIDGLVYDVSNFMAQHPAGAEVIKQHLGMDISPLFNLMHASDVLGRVRDKITLVGVLAPGYSLKVAGAGEEIGEIKRRRENLPPVESVLNLAQFERMAKGVLGADSRAWKFYSSYADDGATFDATRASFSFLRFIPRIFRPVDDISTSTSFLAESSLVPIPLFYSPTGGSSQGHPDGELNVTRAAASTGLPQIVSTMASVAFADIAAERDALVAGGGARAELWWQLYVMSDRKQSEERIRGAVKNGAKAVVVTVDVVAMGNREADAAPAAAKSGRSGSPSQGVAASASRMLDGDLTWADIAWIKQHAPGLPVIVKGITSVADVELAKQFGASGVILSNHGGRQLDGAPPPLATLVRLRLDKPALLEDANFDVYIDGGVRRGTDVLKALCVGAKGVGIGRAALYSSACYGSEGVIRATDILAQEIATGMRLLGAKSVEELKPEMVELLDGLVGKQL